MHSNLAYLARLVALTGALLCLATSGPAGASSAAAHTEGGARAVHGPRQKEFTITVGPIPLDAGGDHHGKHRSHTFLVRLPVEGWLRRYEVIIHDDGGNRLPDRLLHHLNLIAPDRRELFTPIMRRIAAAGHETGRIRTPFRTGYRVERGDSLLVVVMLHNPTDRVLDEAYAQVRIGYTPADTWLPMLSIYPFYLDVMMEPGGRSFDLPPGRTEVSWEGRPAVPGRILGVGGHLHTYATALRFEDVTAGQVIWEAQPILDGEGKLVGMPVSRFLWRLGVPLRPEHTYRLTAVYENPTGEIIRNGGMGVLGGAFVPARGARWPQVDRSDPMYALDREITVSGFASQHGREEEHRGHQHGQGAGPQHDH